MTPIQLLTSENSLISDLTSMYSILRIQLIKRNSKLYTILGDKHYLKQLLRNSCRGFTFKALTMVIECNEFIFDVFIM